MAKEDFIKKLTNVTPQQLNKIIEEKGKKPKLIELFVRVEKNKNMEKKEK